MIAKFLQTVKGWFKRDRVMPKSNRSAPIGKCCCGSDPSQSIMMSNAYDDASDLVLMRHAFLSEDHGISDGSAASFDGGSSYDAGSSCDSGSSFSSFD